MGQGCAGAISRFILALGREFDGRIEGINLPETAFDVAPDERQRPRVHPQTYCDAIITNMVV